VVVFGWGLVINKRGRGAHRRHPLPILLFLAVGLPVAVIVVVVVVTALSLAAVEEVVVVVEVMVVVVVVVVAGSWWLRLKVVVGGCG
jgi:hypothetical protein